MCFHEDKCPYCNETIELQVQRWDTYESCPVCEELIHISFDMIVMEDQNFEEWDLYEFKTADSDSQNF